MSKTRVYELARELNIESRLLVQKIRDMGIEVSSHQSTLDDAQIDQIKQATGAGAAPAAAAPKKKAGAPKVIRRRRAAPPPPEPAVEEPEEVSKEQEAQEQEAEPPPIQASDDVEPRPVPSEAETPAASAAPPAPPESAPPEPEEPQKEPESEASRAPIRSTSGSAEIVRRASPEEVASRRAQAQKSETRRRRPPPGGRDPGGRDPRPQTPPPPGGKRPEAPFGEAPDIGRGDLLGTKDSRQTTKKRRPAEEESSETPAAKKVAKAKRDQLNLRNLLDQAEEPEEEAVAPAGRKRTVYTPTTQNRKRDLKRRKDLKKTQITTPRAAYRIVKMSDQITIADLGRQLGVKGTDLIKKLMAQGMMVTLNESIDFDTASLVAAEYKFEVQSNIVSEDDLLTKGQFRAAEDTVFERPPIVTIMGHVDHGKTSILDAIRETKVASGEAGGITQHIGAYSIETESGKKISFLDTPGHEAFSAMRQRGAKVTDIVILVVAADDGVMPQTVEAISHAKDAGVPIIVAINKIDKPTANFDRVYTELMEHGIQSEEWGGQTQFVKVSALEKLGLDDLLDAVILQAEILELKANIEGDGLGVVVEGHLDLGRGPVATVMVQEGRMSVGDLIVAGATMGKIRGMSDDLGGKVMSAGPSVPVEIIGLDAVPMAGDPVHKISDEKIAKELVALRQKQSLEQSRHRSSAATLESLLGRVTSGETPVVPLIIKGDTQGSVEAVVESLGKLNSDRVQNKVVHKGVGGISESDVRLAATSGGVIIGFNVRLGRGLSELAEQSGVVVRYFSVIYEVVDAVKALMAGTLPPIRTEVVQGHGEVRQTIKVPKIGLVAGTAVLDGKITRNSHLRLIRDDVVVFSGRIGSLRRFKDDVKEVASGYECGIGIEGCNDIREGDVIESYVIQEERATL